MRLHIIRHRRETLAALRVSEFFFGLGLGGMAYPYRKTQIGSLWELRRSFRSYH